MDAKQPTTKKRGRPPGRKTETADAGTVTASRCAKCHSTKRSPYRNSRAIEATGRDPVNQLPFNKIVLRECNCAECGQRRIDRTWLFE